jgi:Trk K+ transport system NAD-binding subunit
MGQKISELKIRETLGINIVGIWERGRFSTPMPDNILTPKSVLLLMGAKDKLLEFDAYMSIYFPADKPIVIIGAGRVGIYVAHELDKKKISYTIVDTIDCNEKLEMGRFVKGDAKEREVLEEAGIMEAPTAVLTTSDDGTNGYLTLYCRALNEKLRIVSRAIFTKNIDTIHKAGADFVVSYSMIGTSIVNNILQKQNLNMLAEGLHIFRHKTPLSIVGQTIAQSKIASLTGCNIIAINRNDELIDSPHFSTVLGAEDVLVMIGNMGQEESFNKSFMSLKKIGTH